MFHPLCLNVPFSPLGPGYPLSPLGPGPPGGPAMAPYPAREEQRHRVSHVNDEATFSNDTYVSLFHCCVQYVESHHSVTLTLEEHHEVSCDVAVGTEDAAHAGRSGGAGWSGGALDRSDVGLRGTLNQILLQHAVT